jgi:hypothetical protein
MKATHVFFHKVKQDTTMKTFLLSAVFGAQLHYASANPAFDVMGLMDPDSQPKFVEPVPNGKEIIRLVFQPANMIAAIALDLQTKTFVEHVPSSVGIQPATWFLNLTLL